MSLKLPITGTKLEHDEKKGLQQAEPKGGAKRKRALESDDTPLSKTSSSKNTKDLKDEKPALENQLEMQSKSLWALKDDLKKHVTTSELKEMLEVNGQDSKGSELDLRARW